MVHVLLTDTHFDGDGDGDGVYMFSLDPEISNVEFQHYLNW
jgi:hypothetical protein